VDLSLPPSKHILALYFPQFHEFEVNNVLWGKGYTDFRGVEAATTARHGYPVIRPLDGFYNTLDYWTRHRQARVARQYGIYGFVYYHYWFNGGPVMEAPLLALLEDGEPDLPFALSWANEHWTRRWDGGNNEVLMEQRYEQGDWRPHFDWLLPLFRHKNYILKDGNKPMLVIYRAADVAALVEMMGAWEAWAIEAGFGGLHLVQMNGVEWSRGAWNLQPSMSGIAEFFPNLYASRELRPSSSLLYYTPERFGVGEEGAVAAVAGGAGGGGASTPPNPLGPTASYYHGVHASFNNKPRHLKDGKETVLPYHPANLRAALRTQLGRTPNGSFVFLNAWNEWGEGEAVEPSLEFGHGFLQAIKDALEEDATGLEAPIVHRVGVPSIGGGWGGGMGVGGRPSMPFGGGERAGVEAAAGGGGGGGGLESAGVRGGGGGGKGGVDAAEGEGGKGGGGGGGGVTAPLSINNPSSAAASSSTTTSTSTTSTSTSHVCIILRTEEGQSDGSGSLFTLRRSMVSLSRLERSTFTAFIVDSGEAPFPDLAAMVEGFGDERFVVVDTPKGLRGGRRTWELIDAMVTLHCVGGGGANTAAAAAGAVTAGSRGGVGGGGGGGGGGGEIEGGVLPSPPPSSPSSSWFLVASGKDWYSPDALNYLPEDADMVLMNFHSKSTLTGHFAGGSGSSGSEKTPSRRGAAQHCCTRLGTYQCPPASPRPGGVELGAMVLSLTSWEGSGVSFSAYVPDGGCVSGAGEVGGEGCASSPEGALAQALDRDLEWRVRVHPPGACALLHNPNPVACAIAGGLYYDTDDTDKAGCFEPPNFPIALNSVDWVKFTDSKGCVCERA
jgi:hypothetical protein